MTGKIPLLAVLASALAFGPAGAAAAADPTRPTIILAKAEQKSGAVKKARPKK